MADQSAPKLRCSARLRNLKLNRPSEFTKSKPEPKNAYESDECIGEKADNSDSEWIDSDEDSKFKRPRKATKSNKKKTVANKQVRPTKKSKTKTDEAPKHVQQPKKPKLAVEAKFNDPSMEIDELDAFGDMPELNVPSEWKNLLDAGLSTSNPMSTSKEDATMEDESSDEEWHEVEAPNIESKKKIVEVRIEKKKNNEQAQEEKQARLEAERFARQTQEDLHRLSFLGYLSHLRYQMLRAKEFCEKYKDELSDVIKFELVNSVESPLEDQLDEFRKRFSEGELHEETTTKSSVERLHSMFRKSIYQTDKDLAMAFLILFMSSEYQCRLYVGFTPEPSLPSTSKIVVKKKAVSGDDENKSHAKKHKQTMTLVEMNKPNYWVEYFDENENGWIAAHPMIGDMHASQAIEKYRPFNYALAIDTDITVTDMTGWYVEKFLHSSVRKSRLSDTWISSFLLMPQFCSSRKRVAVEAQKLREYLLLKPMPKIVSEFKNHILYALEKDLLKFEAIYPSDTKPLGTIRKHNIYPRANVFTLQGELNWIRQARSVKEGEEPYKVVKARPKLSVPKEEREQLYLDTYGYWQTEPYVRPKVVNGKIPRNEFGNVYMYQPQMVPIGCVHLRERGVLQMARTLNLEAVGAVVGWEFSGGRNHPVLDGCVVLAKDAEVLRNACIEWQEIRAQKRAKVVETRALQLWRRFVKGKLLLRKMRTRFNVE